MNLPRRLRRYWIPHGHVDALTGTRIAGWALGRSPLAVEAWLGDRCIARSRPDIARPDVAHAFPGRAGAATSGFAFDLPAGGLASDDLGALQIVARPLRRWLPRATIATLPVAGDGLERRLARAGDSGICGPFPKPVIDAIAAVWPQDCADLATVAGQARFAARLGQIIRTPGINALPAFADYTRYLAVTRAHCRFVERHFPATNRGAEAGSADFHCKPNSVRELVRHHPPALCAAIMGPDRRFCRIRLLQGVQFGDAQLCLRPTGADHAYLRLVRGAAVCPRFGLHGRGNMPAASMKCATTSPASARSNAFAFTRAFSPILSAAGARPR